MLHSSVDFDHNRNGVINPLCTFNVYSQAKLAQCFTLWLDSENRGPMEYEDMGDDGFGVDGMYQEMSDAPADALEDEAPWLEDNPELDNYLEVGQESDDELANDDTTEAFPDEYGKCLTRSWFTPLTYLHPPVAMDDVASEDSGDEYCSCTGRP